MKPLTEAKIAQLGERMTEDHKVRCSIHLLGAFFSFCASGGIEGGSSPFPRSRLPIENFTSVLI